MKVFNSLTNTLEEFQPLDPPEVKMYVCGITTYDSPHIGHARSAVAFDMIRRYLEFKGFHVKYIQNYTDVDDKMITRANKEGVTIYQLAEKYIAEYERMQQQLRIKIPDVKPRATQEIPDMINLIKKIEANGFTYKAEGSVWFDTAKMPRYKEIFRRKKSAGDTEDTEDQSYTQSDYADNKRNVEDFVVWKGEKPGEPAWDSPWGQGRPGWHLECSTMSMKYLGETIDIHGGGKDLKSPHHQNEIAQSESATGKSFCKYWLHNGFLNINNEKMSKSLGNFITAKEVLQKVPGIFFRYYFLTTYYQRPVDFSADKIDQAMNSLKRLQKACEQIQELKQDPKAKIKSEITTQVNTFITEFFASMDEDFNTAKAMGQLFGLINYLQKEILGPSIAVPSSFKKKLVKFFTDIDQFLDIFHEDKTEIEGDSVWKQKTTSLIEALLKLRQDLRVEKNYATSDRIRDLLKGLGVIVNDSKAGTSWEWP